MKGFSKWLVLLAVAILLAVTNPTKSEYVDWLSAKAYQEISKEGALASFVGILLPIDKIIREHTVSRNFLLFSVFHTKVQDIGAVTAVGIFKQIIPLPFDAGAGRQYVTDAHLGGGKEEPKKENSLPNSAAGTLSENRVSSETPPVHLQTVLDAMARTVEVDDPKIHFAPPVPGEEPNLVSVSDGKGGWLTASVGRRTPSADGYGQLVFFFHNDDFVGWDSKYESTSIRSIEGYGIGCFKVTYANYAPEDPLCCPSLPDKVIFYRWNSKLKRFDASDVPPDVKLGRRVEVRYLS